MKVLYLLWTCFTCAVVINGLPVKYDSQGTSISLPKPGAPLDEVIVESSLHIKNKKTQARRTRDTLLNIPNNVEDISDGLRLKRQHHHRRPHHQDVSSQSHPDVSSQSSANAAANGNYFGPNGFGASAANALAQGFYSAGKAGGFGASSANTQTQSFDVGPNGLRGAAGGSFSQVYQLPNGKTINVSFANNIATGPNGNADSNANAVTIT